VQRLVLVSLSARFCQISVLRSSTTLLLLQMYFPIQFWNGSDCGIFPFQFLNRENKQQIPSHIPLSHDDMWLVNIFRKGKNHHEHTNIYLVLKASIYQFIFEQLESKISIHNTKQKLNQNDKTICLPRSLHLTFTIVSQI